MAAAEPSAAGADAAPATPPRIGRLKLAIFALIPAVLLLGLAEIVATLSIAREGRITPAASGSGSVYTMRIGSWPWSRRAVTTLNSLGFPDAEFPAAVDSACTSVVLLGDSFVLGDGVDGDSSFASIVRRDLEAAAGGACLRVFNLGERGSSVPRQARHLRALLPRLRPDVVVLVQYQNDLTDLLNPEPDDVVLHPVATDGAAAHAGAPARADTALDSATVYREPENVGWATIPERLGIFKPKIVRMLSYHVFAALITNGIHRDELRHWSVLADSGRRAEAARLTAQYAAAFDSLATELRDAGIGFGTVIVPSKFDVMAGRFPEEEFFLGLARKHSLPSRRIFPVFDRERSPYVFLMYDGHLNERGHRLVAREISEWLLRSQPAPFGAIRRRSDE